MRIPIYDYHAIFPLGRPGTAIKQLNGKAVCSRACLPCQLILEMVCDPRSGAYQPPLNHLTLDFTSFLPSVFCLFSVPSHPIYSIYFVVSIILPRFLPVY